MFSNRLFSFSNLLLFCQLPTAEEASTAAHKLLTEASTTPSGVAQAPSGRQTRKHVCLHPGCGKVFHFKASADAHQTEHQFLERLGEWDEIGALRFEKVAMIPWSMTIRSANVKRSSRIGRAGCGKRTHTVSSVRCSLPELLIECAVC